jgi:hypothetical protein
MSKLTAIFIALQRILVEIVLYFLGAGKALCFVVWTGRRAEPGGNHGAAPRGYSLCSEPAGELC